MRIDELNDQQVIVVNDYAGAILTPVKGGILDGSWLTTPTWAEAFLARLQGHHALSEEPLSTTQFEAAFNAASRAAGWTVEPAAAATNRFFDTVLKRETERRAISLKASAAKGMSRSTIHISKLTEAAWIQDTRRQVDRRDHLVRLFEEYRAITDAIIILRSFVGEAAVDYELIEIPTSIFAPISNLTVANAQAATIPLAPAGVTIPTLKVRVDRSDAKITLTGIRIEACTVHGTWLLAGDKRNR